MSSVEKFLPKRRTNARTIEIAFNDKAFTDHIIAWLYASSYVNNDEEITKLDIDLPKIVPVKYTIKKQGGYNTG